MDLDAMLFTFFGTTAIESLDDDTLAQGCNRIVVAFGTESDPGRRFALWALLHGLGEAPDPVRAFKDPREQAAALAYLRATGGIEPA